MVHLLSQQIPLAVDVNGTEPHCQEASWNFLSFCFLGSRIFSQPPIASMNCSSTEWWILKRHGCSVSTWFALCYPACSAVIQLSTAWYLESIFKYFGKRSSDSVLKLPILYTQACSCVCLDTHAYLLSSILCPSSL